MAAKIREKERSAILSSLGAGVVPSIGLHHIQVGRKAELEALLKDLERVESGGAAVRFVAGRFGSGKSFFLNLVKTVAMERRLAVASADITTDRRLTGGGGGTSPPVRGPRAGLSGRLSSDGSLTLHTRLSWTAGPTMMSLRGSRTNSRHSKTSSAATTSPQC